MATELYLQRIASELHELNATLNCRFDALDEISAQLKDIDASIGGMGLSLADLDSVQNSIWGVKDAVENIRC